MRSSGLRIFGLGAILTCLSVAASAGKEPAADHGGEAARPPASAPEDNRATPGIQVGSTTAPDQRPAKGDLLHTEAFESGELQLGDIESARLEDFLRDLNNRRSFDVAQHGGKAGPDADYLQTWMGKVADELCRRGYYRDDQSALRRPDNTLVQAK